jgi:DNA end-binding protein Ku
MVSIPVKLYSAAESDERPFPSTCFHKDCGSRLSQQYICKKDGQVVAARSDGQGVRVLPRPYVIFTPEEIKELEEKSVADDRDRGVRPAP